MKGLAGKSAIITGGASGLGAGLVKAFVEAGVKVVSADVSTEQGQRIVDELGGECAFKKTDLRQDSEIDAVVAETADRFGGIDFIINAACTYDEQGLDSSREKWLNGFDVNVFGHVGLVQRALPYLKKSTYPGPAPRHSLHPEVE